MQILPPRWKYWHDMEWRPQLRKLRDPARENRRGFLRRQRSWKLKTTRLRRRRKWSRCEVHRPVCSASKWYHYSGTLIARRQKELVRQTWALEKSETARKADEELLDQLQSRCDELRAQHAEAELQLAEVEGHNRHATDRTRKELVLRVNRCLRGYACWEVTARERMTLREMEIRAAALMSGDNRSRRRLAKRLESFLSRSRYAIANLEAEVASVLRRFGLRRRADEWTGRKLVSSGGSHRRHSR
ncbi:hypothetical protein AXG93_2145s1920 [Marchantia polymorpha subsp. ruderalis]|uniref:Uncharacterized protein n=1 Tax=Marchantia polymorpha subsp. ruderalis TaxID=1480154 RepID=A0A176W095_MARPO|nr:hypothetical protein AXG93_2145s1920 [Marchantia polymorpha subsp. ruderalis]